MLDHKKGRRTRNSLNASQNDPGWKKVCLQSKAHMMYDKRLRNTLNITISLQQTNQARRRPLKGWPSIPILEIPKTAANKRVGTHAPPQKADAPETRGMLANAIQDRKKCSETDVAQAQKKNTKLPTCDNIGAPSKLSVGITLTSRLLQCCTGA